MNAALASPPIRNAVLLASRALLAAIFVLSGLEKVVGYAGTEAYMAKAGVPGFLLPLVIATELGGGLLILLGWQTRLVAFLLAGFTLLTGLLFHMSPDQQVQLLKNLAITGGFLALLTSGPGQWSLDRGKA